MGKLGILLVIVLGAIAVAQLVRVYEHTLKLKKTGEHDINDRDNNLNAWLMLLFMIFQFGGFIYLMLAYGWTGRGPSASLEGEETDWLLNLNFVIIIAIFFLTNFLLFYFSYKYVRKPGVRATYFPHNNKLEMIWTIVPACVLAVIIILGLRSWNNLTSPSGDGAVVIELYSKQFDWTARYAGEDNVLGKYDYKLTTGTNELGILTTKTIEDAIVEREKKVNAINKLLSNADTVLSDSLVEAQEFTLSHNERILRSLYQLKQNHNKEVDKNAEDDIIVKGTLVLCVGQEYEFNFRSMDVIHSAYFPHFRAQINTVPGMTTRTKFTPSITTAEMREIKNDPKFKYVLMCNKICGKAHYKMKMDIEVLSKAEYAAWLAGKKKETFKLKYGSAPAEGGDDMAKEEGGKSGGDMPAEEATGEAAPIKKEDEI